MNATSPARKSSTGRNPYAVELAPRADGSFGALSSDGDTIYSVRLVAGAWTCQCKGYASRSTCCHTLAAQLPRCWHCGSASDVHLYRNHYEPETPILLCESCAGEASS